MKLSTLSITILSGIFSTQTFADSKLEPIVISADHIKTSKHSVSADSTIITAEEITNKNYITLDDALKNIPGIQITRNGGLGSTTSIFMRGQSNKATLVLINGINMTNPMGTGGAIISNLLLTNIQRIEVLKGAQSGIWGADASAGVINIVTKAAKKGTQGSVTLESGSNNLKQITASFAEKIEQGDVSLSFSNITTDGFSAVKEYQESADNYEDDAFQQTHLNLDIGINFSNEHRMELLVKDTTSSSDYDYFNNPNQSTSASVNYQNNIKRLQYVYGKNSEGNLKTTTYLYQNDISQYNDASTKVFGIKGGYLYLPDQSISFVASKTKFSKLNSNLNYENTGLGLTNTNHLNNKNLILTQSLRSDQFNKFDDKITAKLGIKNHFSNNLSTRANIGTAYNAPTLYQLTYGITTNLNPEKSSSFDIGITSYGFDISYYQAETKNLITYDGTWPNDYYKNLDGTAKFTGLDISYQTFFDSISTHIQATYSQTSAKDDNNQSLARRAEQTATLNISYNGINNFTLSASNRYIGKKYDKDNKQGAQIGEYLVTDFNINYQASESLSLYGKVLNAFAQDYTHAVSEYIGATTNPKHVYSNGGRQLFIGIQGRM
jgi:vitamin B12 transporter